MRASIVLGVLCVASVAAAATEWTLPLGPEWKDVTTEMMAVPAMGAQKEVIIKAGGTFDAQIFRNDEVGGIMVIVSRFGGASSRIEELNNFQQGSRTRAVQNGKERDWNVEQTPTMVVATQRADLQGIQVTIKTYVGSTEDDAVQAVAFMCYATDDVCASLLGKATVSNAGLVPLANLDAHRKRLTPRRLGWIVGSVATLIFVLGALWKRRPRAPK